MRAATVLFLPLLALPFVALVAQGHPQLAPGDRIRVHLAVSELPVVGTVIALDGDSLRVRAAGQGGSLSIPTSSVREVERSQWRHSYADAGGSLGALVGAVFGGEAGARLPASCSSAPLDLCTGLHHFTLMALGGLLGACAGAATGSAIGSAVHREGWGRFPFSRSEATVGPHGASLVLGFAF